MNREYLNGTAVSCFEMGGSGGLEFSGQTKGLFADCRVLLLKSCERLVRAWHIIHVCTFKVGAQQFCRVKQRP